MRLFGIKQDIGPKRKELKDVRAGDTITVYWNDEQPSMEVKVINNDPATKRILIEVHYAGEKKSWHKPYDYSHYMFKDFHLMNGGTSRSEEELNTEISLNIKELKI